MIIFVAILVIQNFNQLSRYNELTMPSYCRFNFYISLLSIVLTLYSQNPLQLVKFVYIQYEVLTYHFDFGSPRCLPNTWVCQMPSWCSVVDNANCSRLRMVLA